MAQSLLELLVRDLAGRSRLPARVRHPYDGRQRKDVTVNAHDRQAEEFERHRRHPRGVAYRMLGSMSDADDVVQESWLRLNRSDADSGRIVGIDLVADPSKRQALTRE
jgi:hypothetical protein